MTKVCNVKHTKFNNNFTKQKGFTIVELVIVIAVIGILAAVLIPVLNSLINKADESKARQEVMGVVKEYLTEQTNTKLDNIVILYLEESSLSEDNFKVEYIYGYLNSSLILKTYETINFSSHLLSLDGAVYHELDTSFIKNMPEYIRIYEINEEFIKYSVRVMNEDYETYLTEDAKTI